MQDKNAEQRQFRKMTQAPVPRLIVTLAIPTIFTMLITAVYNMADTFFVARLGTSAAGAVGIVFAMMAVIQSLGFMIGMGSGSLVSRALGERRKEKADEFASTAFVMAIGAGTLLAAAGLAFTERIMILLGATPTILPYAMDYARYIFFGTPFMCCSFVLNNLLRSEGKPVFATIAIGFGGLLNIALDPLFIFTFKLGISGAAIATLISQCISFSILLYFFISGKSITKLSIRHVARYTSVYLQILSIGFPSFCRQGLASISTVALNIAAANYGDAAVAAMSIVGRIFFLVLAILIGFGHGFQPVVGYNYGAKCYGRVHEAFFFCIRAGTVFLACAGIAGFIFAPEIMGLFRKEDAAVLAIGTAALRAQCAALPFQPLSVLSNMLFQSVGKPVQATFVAATRQGIYFIPLIIILPCFFGLGGVEFTQCISDFLSFLSCIPLLIPFFRDLRRREMQEGSCGMP